MGVVGQRLYEEPADWRAFLPKDLGAFTARDLSEAIGIRRQLAQRMVYCLRKVRVVKLISKQGRANLYRAVDAQHLAGADRAIMEIREVYAANHQG